MKKSPPPFLISLFLRAGWAPVAVLVLFQGIHFFGLRGAPGTDVAIHSLGGASVAFFYFRALPFVRPWLGDLTRATGCILALSLSLSTALVWEFAEFLSDCLFDTDMQHSLQETMTDLLSGSIAAVLVIILFALFSGSPAAFERKQ